MRIQNKLRAIGLCMNATHRDWKMYEDTRPTSRASTEREYFVFELCSGCY